ncbi:MAG: redox-sensing transcriptional repressor Rex [Peptococcaceae bacterium]|nr:redox-sensing transcriptional repressor Rex [Peptococcaceae bacterium]
MKPEKVPEATITRLSLYSRFLDEMLARGVEKVSSVDIAKGVQGTPAQVRKDLAYFGDFGMRGVGYNVANLNAIINEILGVDHPWKMILIGAGNLGSALTHYAGFAKRGFRMSAVFDNDVNKIGMTLNGLPILPITQLVDYVDANGVDIAVLAVPAASAQGVADLLCETKIKGIMNFSPSSLVSCDSIEIRQIDLAVSLEGLSYRIKNK